MVNASSTEQPLEIDFDGVSGTHAASIATLHASSYEATNSITAPDLIRPAMSSVRVSGTGWKHTVPALTIEVLDIPLR